MAHVFIKKIFEPFMMELRFLSNHLRPKTQARGPKPPITKFEAPKRRPDQKNASSVQKFKAGDEKTSITYTIRMKKGAKASPIETIYVRSFPKKASTPLVKFPGYPSTMRPGVYFPTNWRWYAERREPGKPLMNEAWRNSEPETSDGYLRRLNQTRIEDLKRKLSDSSMLRGAHPKSEG